MPRVAATLVLTAGLSSCGGAGTADDELRAAASFYPLAWVSEQVAGERWTVTNLTQAGSEPHDLELSLAQTAEVAAADLVVVEHGLQPAVDDVVASVAEGEVLDAAEVVHLRPAGASHEHEHEGHESDAHVEEGPEGEPHEHGALDPHFWLDPLELAEVGVGVAERLGRIDPAHAAAYEENAKALTGRLTQLDAAYADGLTGCDRHTVVVSHDAFGYLARYGLDFHAIAGLSPEAEPTAADIAELQDLVAREGITTVFSERLASPKMSQILADDTGVATGVLDPVEGLSTETSGEDYISLMTANLSALKKANGCH